MGGGGGVVRVWRGGMVRECGKCEVRKVCRWWGLEAK